MLKRFIALLLSTYLTSLVAALVIGLISMIFSSCMSIRWTELEMYKKAVYKYCVTDSEYEAADKLIYERFYSCDHYPAHEF